MNTYEYNCEWENKWHQIDSPFIEICEDWDEQLKKIGFSSPVYHGSEYEANWFRIYQKNPGIDVKHKYQWYILCNLCDNLYDVFIEHPASYIAFMKEIEFKLVKTIGNAEVEIYSTYDIKDERLLEIAKEYSEIQFHVTHTTAIPQYHIFGRNIS